MVEMHLLSVNVDFRYDAFYALGVVSSFDRFMQGYQPENDQASMFNALCVALEKDPQQFQHDARRLEELASRVSGKDLIAWLSLSNSIDGTDDLREQLQAIANNPNFKYSRLFAIGLFRMLELSNPELIKDEKQLTEALKQICTALKLPEDRVQKDLELFRSNLEKMAQARIVLADTLQAERKKREERAAAKEALNSASQEATQAPDSSKDEAPSGS
jgi:photosystem II biogenesis protein Psp29